MYKIKVRGKARKQLLKIRPPHFQRLQTQINRLANDPRFSGTIKLQGETGYQMRVGDYRVLYDIDDVNQVVTIYRVKHRRDVYRK